MVGMVVTPRIAALTTMATPPKLSGELSSDPGGESSAKAQDPVPSSKFTGNCPCFVLLGLHELRSSQSFRYKDGDLEGGAVVFSSANREGKVLQIPHL